MSAREPASRLRALTGLPSAFVLATALTFVVLRVLAFEWRPETWSDTKSYEDQAAHPITGRTFWAGARSFTFPLAWKLLRNEWLIVSAQFVLSTVAWLTLAFVAARVLSSALPVRVGTVIAIAGFGLTAEVSHWDDDLLSESFSLTFLALALAAGLALIEKPSIQRVGLAVVPTALWVFTRDSNAYALLPIAGAALVAAVATSHKRVFVVASGAALLLFLLSAWSADAGNRALFPVADVVLQRLARDDPGAVEELGRRGWEAYNPTSVREYRRYLLDDPIGTLTAPLRDEQTRAPFSSRSRLQGLWAPEVRGYDRKAYVWRAPRPIQDVFSLRPLWLVLAAALASFVAAAAVVRAYGSWWPMVVWVGALVVAYSQLLVVWHGSGQEIDRHALTGSVSLRLGLWVSVLLSAHAAREPLVEYSLAVRRWALQAADSLLSGRHAPARVIGATLAALAVLLVLVQVGPGLERVHDAAGRNEGFTPQERRLVSAYGVDISREFLDAALRLLPPDASYAVVTGPNVQVSTPITLSALAPYAQSLLLPRRQRPFFDADTEYLLCYGCDLGQQQSVGPIRVLWNGEPGLAIARRAR